MCFSRLEVAHKELYLGKAEESLEIFRVVSKTLLVPLEGRLISLLHVLYFA